MFSHNFISTVQSILKYSCNALSAGYGAVQEGIEYYGMLKLFNCILINFCACMAVLLEYVAVTLLLEHPILLLDSWYSF